MSAGRLALGWVVCDALRIALASNRQSGTLDGIAFAKDAHATVRVRERSQRRSAEGTPASHSRHGLWDCGHHRWRHRFRYPALAGFGCSARNPVLIIAVWLVGGIYAFCCTLSVTELGTMLPRAGGWYVYSRRAFGEYAGFLVGCMDWIANAVAIEYLAVAFGDFAAELQPSLHGHVEVVPVASVGGLTLLNWLGLRAGSRMQELTSMVKTLALIAFVVACFAICPHSAPDRGALPASLAAPELRSGCNVHQLGFDVEFTAMLHHAPRQRCIDMQIVPDPLRIILPRFVVRHSAVGHHLEIREPGKRVGDLLGDASPR